MASKDLSARMFEADAQLTKAEADFKKWYAKAVRALGRAEKARRTQIRKRKLLARLQEEYYMGVKEANP